MKVHIRIKIKIKITSRYECRNSAFAGDKALPWKRESFQKDDVGLHLFRALVIN